MIAICYYYYVLLALLLMHTGQLAFVPAPSRTKLTWCAPVSCLLLLAPQVLLAISLEDFVPGRSGPTAGQTERSLVEPHPPKARGTSWHGGTGQGRAGKAGWQACSSKAGTHTHNKQHTPHQKRDEEASSRDTGQLPGGQCQVEPDGQGCADG